jgi:flagellar biogenesis protein FliO
MQRTQSTTRFTLALIAALALTTTATTALAANALEAIENPSTTWELKNTAPVATTKTGDTVVESTQTVTAPVIAPTEEPISLREEDGRGVMTWLALILLGGAAFGTMVLLRRRQTTSDPSRPVIEVLHSARIGGKWQVSLVRVPGKTLVLGVTDKGLSTLSEIEDMPSMPVDVPAAMTIVENSAQEPVEETVVAAKESAAVLDEILNLTHRNQNSASTKIPSTDHDRRAILERLESYRREGLGS